MFPVFLFCFFFFHNWMCLFLAKVVGFFFFGPQVKDEYFLGFFLFGRSDKGEKRLEDDVIYPAKSITILLSTSFLVF